MAFNYDRYLRFKRMPHIWCPGCGHGIIMKAMIRAIDALGLEKDKTVIVSGIGCASRLPGYLDFNTLHTTHGRAIPFATGIKLVRPELNVLVVAGDGDILAIGGNHFIHACRRNLDITCIIFNNFVYGMTGGQFSPTTMTGFFTTTTPYGNPDEPFDTVRLAIGCGANFVARSVCFNAVQVQRYIKEAISHKGFSVVEVIDSCYTTFGRRNRQRFRSVIDMMKWEKENSISLEAAKNKSPEELQGKILTGVFHRGNRKEYLEVYREMVLTKAEKLGKDLYID